jgi:hypothetical protein
VALPLPPSWGTAPAPSVLFERPGSIAGRPPSLYRVTIRAFPEDADAESFDPFVVFIVERATAAAAGATP